MGKWKCRLGAGKAGGLFTIFFPLSQPPCSPSGRLKTGSPFLPFVVLCPHVHHTHTSSLFFIVPPCSAPGSCLPLKTSFSSHKPSAFSTHPWYPCIKHLPSPKCHWLSFMSPSYGNLMISLLLSSHMADPSPLLQGMGPCAEPAETMTSRNQAPLFLTAPTTPLSNQIKRLGPTGWRTLYCYSFPTPLQDTTASPCFTTSLQLSILLIKMLKSTRPTADPSGIPQGHWPPLGHRSVDHSPLGTTIQPILYPPDSPAFKPISLQ